MSSNGPIWVGNANILAETIAEEFAEAFGRDPRGRYTPLPYESDYIAYRVVSQYLERKSDFHKAMSHGNIREGIRAVAHENGEHPYTVLYGVPSHVARAFEILEINELMFVCQLGDFDERILSQLTARRGGDDISASNLTQGTYSGVPSEYRTRALLCSRLIGTKMAYPLLLSGIPAADLDARSETLAECIVMGVPAAYAAVALSRGLDPDQILRYHQEGIAAEYLP